MSGRFMAAYMKGARDYNRAFLEDGEGLDEIIKIMTEYTDLKEPRCTKVNVAGLNPNGAVNQTALEGDFAVVQGSGLLYRGVGSEHGCGQRSG
ncbi:MAG: hypothetical protein U0401_13855 [Anaerolineae bacterium]